MLPKLKISSQARDVAGGRKKLHSRAALSTSYTFTELNLHLQKMYCIGKAEDAYACK